MSLLVPGSVTSHGETLEDEAGIEPTQAQTVILLRGIEAAQTQRRRLLAATDRMTAVPQDPTIALEVEGLRRWYDLSPPWLERVVARRRARARGGRGAGVQVADESGAVACRVGRGRVDAALAAAGGGSA